MGQDRFIAVKVTVLETDLWIGVDETNYSSDLEKFVFEKVFGLRSEIDAYLKRVPEFFDSFSTVNPGDDAPEICKKMASAASCAGIGPKSAVAGAFSEYIGKQIENEFSPEELVVENGGDIYLNIKNELAVSVYAGNSPLSEKVGIRIPPEFSPLGICTSSGTVGHSISYGKADAIMVACKNTLLADALATAYGNKINTEKDINAVVEEINNKPEILSAIIIKGDKIAICGNFELTMFEH